MAINLEDTSSGFRHMDVVMFINEEVLRNGGRSDFYSACRSLHWPEVEDRLQVILGDPRLPRSAKRACAWSALALAVRFAARQRDKQERRIQKLQNQVIQSEMKSRTLMMELQRLQKEREELTVQLRSTMDDLQQSLEELWRVYWENKIGKPHTVPYKVAGRCGSVLVPLIPAPQGTGIISGFVPKMILLMAGIDDCYTSTRGLHSYPGQLCKSHL
ncbi:PREDICTED: testis-expressed sequence 13A protein-like [Elephantulus edwardii]|uniref:testis-expressed sequence 13A protein-like n=1 Tax=Elephantulus edwardii TaxID=28737 RepID=UPI0003F0878D|nr:PREDICTED: testis-expressed sequence 13A protein-like [Elephantulus edwardii]